MIDRLRPGFGLENQNSCGAVEPCDGVTPGVQAQPEKRQASNDGQERAGRHQVGGLVGRGPAEVPEPEEC